MFLNLMKQLEQWGKKYPRIEWLPPAIVEQAQHQFNDNFGFLRLLFDIPNTQILTFRWCYFTEGVESIWGPKLCYALFLKNCSVALCPS